MWFAIPIPESSLSLNVSFEENTLSNIAKLDHSIMHKSHIILHDITKSGQQGIPVPSRQGWEALPVPVIMIQTTFYPSCCGWFLWGCFLYSREVNMIPMEGEFITDGLNMSWSSILGGVGAVVELTKVPKVTNTISFSASKISQLKGKNC